MTATPHRREGLEPSAPDEAAEAAYLASVLGVPHPAPVTDAEMDIKLDASARNAQIDADRWDAIYRAAVCAAAQAIQARDWVTKKAALAIASQADTGRQVLFAALFGEPKEIPAAYAGFEKAGRNLTRTDSSAALKIIAADRAAFKNRRAK